MNRLLLSQGRLVKQSCVKRLIYLSARFHEARCQQGLGSSSVSPLRISSNKFQIFFHIIQSKFNWISACPQNCLHEATPEMAVICHITKTNHSNRTSEIGVDHMTSGETTSSKVLAFVGEFVIAV